MRTPEQGHGAQCYSLALDDAMSTILDDNRRVGISDHNSGVSLRTFVAEGGLAALADENLASGTTQCICPPIGPSPEAAEYRTRQYL